LQQYLFICLSEIHNRKQEDYSNMKKLEDALADACNAMGALPENFALDGSIYRFVTDTVGHPKSKDGWIIGEEHPKRHATFGSHRESWQHTWWEDGRIESSFLEFKKQIKENQQKQQKKSTAASASLLEKFKKWGRANPEHAYIKKKQIEVQDDFRGVYDNLVIPIYLNGDMISVQYISETGEKKFAKGPQVRGGYYPFGKMDVATIYVAEGVADAGAIAADTIKKAYPSARIIIVADNDDAGRKAVASSLFPVIYPEGCSDVSDLLINKGEEAVAKFISENTSSEDPQWAAGLIVRKGKILHRTHNINLFLTYHPEFRGRFRYNEFERQVEIDGDPVDDQYVDIKAKLETFFGEAVATSNVLESIGVVSREYAYHPIKEYLSALAWDGKHRIATFFSKYCQTDADVYHQSVAFSLFVSAVARVYSPGCKVDTMTILVGKQGVGKTRCWETLFGEWIGEMVEEVNSKDFFISLGGKWGVVFDELEQFRRDNQARIKQVISMTTDRYREPYGRIPKEWKRQCVFVGTTNVAEFNKDHTGARRFLPIRVGEIDINGIQEIKDQLWAEAVIEFTRGYKWWEIKDAESHQEGVYEEDAWTDPISRWLERTPDEFTMNKLLEEALNIESGRQTRSDQTRAGRVLTRLGYTNLQKRIGGQKRIRVYVRPSTIIL
jgi:putative DNA primase/helicase